jgi:hypothetical protein
MALFHSGSCLQRLNPSPLDYGSSGREGGFTQPAVHVNFAFSKPNGKPGSATAVLISTEQHQHNILCRPQPACTS